MAVRQHVFGEPRAAFGSDTAHAHARKTFLGLQLIDLDKKLVDRRAGRPRFMEHVSAIVACLHGAARRMAGRRDCNRKDSPQENRTNCSF